MTEPLYIQTVRDFRAALDARYIDELQQMTDAWYMAGQRLLADMEDLATFAANKYQSGGSVTRGMLYELNRYRLLLLQVNAEIERLTGRASSLIDEEQRIWAVYGDEYADNMVENIQHRRGEGLPEIEAGFDVLYSPAVEHVVSLARAGKPLDDLLRNLSPLTADTMTRVLIEGTSAGWWPRDTAREMMGRGFGSSLQKALVVARDIQNRTFRESARQGYQVLGVQEYKRLAAKQPRTCFPAGTEILVAQYPNSLGAIEVIQPGDLVKTSGGWRPVEEVVIKPYSGDMVELTFAEGGSLICTADHQLMQYGKSWQEAGKFRPGQRVDGAQGPLKIIDRTAWIETNSVVYNLSVVDVHNFYANGVLVHNCAACLALDGSTQKTDQLMALHPQDRCSIVPVIPGYEVDWELGKDWFNRQPEHVQLEILGPGRLDAYNANKFKFEDLVTVKENETWGPVALVTPLKDLV